MAGAAAQLDVAIKAWLGADGPARTSAVKVLGIEATAVSGVIHDPATDLLIFFTLGGLVAKEKRVLAAFVEAIAGGAAEAALPEAAARIAAACGLSPASMRESARRIAAAKAAR